MTLQKRPFTLIELLIAMGLASLIIGALGYFYKQIEAMGKIMDQDQALFFERRYVENRLADVIPKTDGKGVFFLATPFSPSMLTSSPNLIFQFDNCVRLDKQFAFVVLGRLYIDLSGKLILARWPTLKFWSQGVPPPVKKEVLMENVEAISFLFFVAPKKEGKDQGNDQKVETNQSQIDPALRGTWIREWKRDWREVPAAVRIDVMQKGEKITYSYPIILKNRPITYNR